MAQEFDKDTLEALDEQASLMAKTEETPEEPKETPEPTEEPKPEEDSQEKPDEDIDLNLDEPEDKPEDKPKSMQDKLKEAGLADVTKILKDHEGVVPDAVIKAAKEKLDPDVVDLYVEKVQTEYKNKEYEAANQEKQAEAEKVAKMNKYIYDSIGGEDKFKSMAGVLRAGMDKDTLKSLNAKLLSGNKLLVNEALKTAVTEYKKIKGFGGVRMEGDANAPQEKSMRITKEDYRTIMKSEKYKTDPMYRNKIDDARLKTRQDDQAKYGPGMYYGYNQNGRYEL